jgi:hypothetical protein
MIAIKAKTYNITSSINTKRYWHSMCKIKSLYYHNAMNIINLLIYIMLLRHYTIKGDVSLSSRLVLGGKEVDVLQTKPMKIIYTSVPNAI